MAGPTYFQHVDDWAFGESDGIFELSIVTVINAHDFIKLGKQRMEIAKVVCNHLINLTEHIYIFLFSLSLQVPLQLHQSKTKLAASNISILGGV